MNNKKLYKIYKFYDKDIKKLTYYVMEKDGPLIEYIIVYKNGTLWESRGYNRTFKSRDSALRYSLNYLNNIINFDKYHMKKE